MGRHVSDGREASSLAETTVRIPVLRSGGAHRRPVQAAARNRGKILAAALTATAVLAVVTEFALPHHHDVVQPVGAMEDVAVPGTHGATPHDAAAPTRPTDSTPLPTTAQATSVPVATPPSASSSTGSSSSSRKRPTSIRPTGAPGSPPPPTGSQPPSTSSSDPTTPSSEPPSKTGRPPTTTSAPGGGGDVISNLPVLGPVVGGLLPGN